MLGERIASDGVSWVMAPAEWTVGGAAGTKRVDFNESIWQPLNATEITMPRQRKKHVLDIRAPTKLK